MIDFEIKIDPKGLQRLAGKMQQYVNALQASSETALKEVATLYYTIVIDHMGEISSSGGLAFPGVDWAPLNKAWVLQKIKSGWVPEIWEATGSTKRSVAVHAVQKTANGFEVFVGLKGVPIDMMLAALENEFGSGLYAKPSTSLYGNIPARPLFEPAKREVLRGKNRTEITEAFKRAAKAAYQSFAYGKP